MKRRAWLGPWIVLTAVAAPGCEALSYYPDGCDNRNSCGDDNCPGQCVPLPSIDFSGPALLWIGREVEAPECPDKAPRPIYQGHGDLDDSNECAPCACSEPACALPAGVTASSSPMCQGPGFVDLDAPAGWDGSCASPGVVGAAQLGSITMGPVTAIPCAPVVDRITAKDLGVPSPWGTFARACAGEALPHVCNDPGQTCLPSAEPPPPGFRQCYVHLRDGDPQCPPDFPEKHTFYGDLEDTRACTACACTETVASECAAVMTAYEDGICGDFIVSSMMMADAICLDVGAGTTLGSFKASWTVEAPGSCVATGGAPTGGATPLDPRTFCCQALPAGG